MLFPGTRHSPPPPPPSQPPPVGKSPCRTVSSADSHRYDREPFFWVMCTAKEGSGQRCDGAQNGEDNRERETGACQRPVAVLAPIPWRGVRGWHERGGRWWMAGPASRPPEGGGGPLGYTKAKVGQAAVQPLPGRYCKKVCMRASNPMIMNTSFLRPGLQQKRISLPDREILRVKKITKKNEEKIKKNSWIN